MKSKSHADGRHHLPTDDARLTVAARGHRAPLHHRVHAGEGQDRIRPGAPHTVQTDHLHELPEMAETSRRISEVLQRIETKLDFLLHDR